MATETENIKLKKLEDSDKVVKDIFNENVDILEAKLTELEEGQTADITALEERVTATETGLTNLAATVAAKKDERAITFLSADYEIRYPWKGTAKQITVSLKSVRTTDTSFELQRQSSTDYAAQTANWEKIGGQTFNLVAGSVSGDYSISHGITAGDILRLYTTSDDSDMSVQLFILNG
ncbi:hypothetical protein [Sporomusa aerivorans]|uniref:hypothetical protein n=1 Tax=Sporomusa aerivorans TaxID=204936 RepID=UPI00352A146E